MFKIKLVTSPCQVSVLLVLPGSADVTTDGQNQKHSFWSARPDSHPRRQSQHCTYPFSLLRTPSIPFLPSRAHHRFPPQTCSLLWLLALFSLHITFLGMLLKHESYHCTVQSLSWLLTALPEKASSFMCLVRCAVTSPGIFCITSLC